MSTDLTPLVILGAIGGVAYYGYTQGWFTPAPGASNPPASPAPTPLFGGAVYTCSGSSCTVVTPSNQSLTLTQSQINALIATANANPTALIPVPGYTGDPMAYFNPTSGNVQAGGLSPVPSINASGSFTNAAKAKGSYSCVNSVCNIMDQKGDIVHANITPAQTSAFIVAAGNPAPSGLSGLGAGNFPRQWVNAARWSHT